jgi:hypothetical protein
VSASRTEIDERFTAATLDPDVWFPWYLPHWSSRAGSAATWALTGEGLVLRIPEDQPPWCPQQHEEPLRVSCIQTGSFSGPVGSAVGQQPFRDGLVVREEQPAFWGYTPDFREPGHVEVRMRATITERSMFAFWLSGIEDRPERSGEVCVAEVFGDAVRDGHAEVGMGVHRFRDPALVEQFAPEPLALDVAELHTYGVDWEPGSLAFTVDGHVVRRLDQTPDYPLQLMIGVFDFPARAAEAAAGDGPVPVPELVVAHVRGFRGTLEG